MGVLLTDGAGEIELASAFRPYTTFSYVARPIAVTVDGNARAIPARPDLRPPRRAVHRRRGPRPPGRPRRRRRAPRTSRPGSACPKESRRSTCTPGQRFAFEGALRDIARTYDVATARWVAKTLEYPTAGLMLAGPGWPWGPPCARSGRRSPRQSSPSLAILVGRPCPPCPETSALRPAGRFVRHYLEMVVAMLVGMGVLGLLWNIVWPGLSAHEGSARCCHGGRHVHRHVRVDAHPSPLVAGDR